jgi:hypothetical protein
MWICVYIVLHNLILQIKDWAEHFNSKWREELYQGWVSLEGVERQCRRELELDDNSGDESDLGCARRRVISDGQWFRLKVMNDFFNSPTSGAVCCI